MSFNETVIPCIRTRKRRLVPPEKRKKASFSCDRCKLRKIACQRRAPSQRCDGCERAGTECETTIKRKKKVKGPIENIGLHYKCLLALIQFLFPEIDVNNIDALIDLGERNGVVMPSRYGGKDDKTLTDLSLLITSGRVPPSSRASSIDLRESQPEAKLEESDDLAGDVSLAPTELPPFSPEKSSPLPFSLPLVHQDLVVTDHHGNKHMVGPSGSAALFDSSLKTLQSMFNLDIFNSPSLQHAFRGNSVISSNNEPINLKELTFLHHQNFPYLEDISFEEGNYLTECFFSNVHPRNPCFVRRIFNLDYEKFWNSVRSKSPDKYLSHHTICCIYMVWLLGRLFNPANIPSVDESVATRYLNVVKLCLSDITLTPTLDGIRTLMLLAIYMENTTKRECSYVLTALAARQAVTLGFNREAVVTQNPDVMRVEELKRVWWTIFTMEVLTSCQMGRSSTIRISDVNVSYPLYYDVVNSSEFPSAYRAVLDLSRNMYDILKYRQVVNRNEDLLSKENLERAVLLDRQLSCTMLKVDPALLNLSMISDYKIHLLMRFHYYRILLILPTFLRVAQAPQCWANPELQTLVSLCLSLCIASANVAQASCTSNILNGTVHADIFFTFHAVMGLIVGFCLLSDSEVSKIMRVGVEIEELEHAIDKVRQLALKDNSSYLGTSHKLSKFIDALICGYEYIKTQRHHRNTHGSVEPCSGAHGTVLDMFAATKTKVKVEEDMFDQTFDEYFIRPGRGELSDSHPPYEENAPFGDIGFGFPGQERFISDGVIPNEF